MKSESEQEAIISKFTKDFVEKELQWNDITEFYSLVENNDDDFIMRLWNFCSSHASAQMLSPDRKYLIRDMTQTELNNMRLIHKHFAKRISDICNKAK
jgi:hypothetical protein